MLSSTFQTLKAHSRFTCKLIGILQERRIVGRAGNVRIEDGCFGRFAGTVPGGRLVARRGEALVLILRNVVVHVAEEFDGLRHLGGFGSLKAATTATYGSGGRCRCCCGSRRGGNHFAGKNLLVTFRDFGEFGWMRLMLLLLAGGRVVFYDHPHREGVLRSMVFVRFLT